MKVFDLLTEVTELEFQLEMMCRLLTKACIKYSRPTKTAIEVKLKYGCKCLMTPDARNDTWSLCFYTAFDRFITGQSDVQFDQVIDNIRKTASDIGADFVSESMSTRVSENAVFDPDEIQFYLDLIYKRLPKGISAYFPKHVGASLFGEFVNASPEGFVRRYEIGCRQHKWRVVFYVIGNTHNITKTFDTPEEALDYFEKKYSDLEANPKKW